MDFSTLIDVGSLQKLLDAGSPAILDCRFDLADAAAGERAYVAAHIPTARFADLNRDLAGPVSSSSGRHPLPDPAVLAGRLSGLGVGGDRQVVAYDEASGAFAARAWWLLRWLGHSRVAVLDGGFKAWVAGGGALESGEARAAGASSGFVPKISAGAVVGSTDVLAALKDPGRLLIDARAPERFAGSVEPIDPVAGHVPGAVNHPFGTNLGADGRFLPPAELRRRWLDRLGGAEPSASVAMCGSGVTACHNLLAMEIAGLPGGKLYAGSWSEWIRDPGHPVARG
jgi:thiosulfate/3-mercaptopyruvate sulfurtransferase